MKFDRNTVLGFLLLAALFIGFFYMTGKQQAESRKEQARIDSIANAQKPKPDPSFANKDAQQTAALIAQKDSLNAGSFPLATKGKEELTYAENEYLKIAFTNAGGRPKWIELKKFKNMDSGFVKLAASDFDTISYNIATGNNKQTSTAKLSFHPGTIVSNADSTTITFVCNSSDTTGNNASIIHQYIIKKNDYMIDFNVQLNGADKLLTDRKLNLTWQYSAAQQESGIIFEKTNTQVGYVEDGDFDYKTIGKHTDITFDKPVNWIGVRQRFFNGYLIAKNNFSSGNIRWDIPPDDQKIIMQATTVMQAPVSASGKVELSLFYGPADYHILKKYDLKLSNTINFGQGMYAFVSPLNKFVILPVWDFLKGLVGNYGIVILLLTLFIRLLISPLTYKSYLSGAKMKALRPEIAKLKEKHAGDQQAMSVDQMKLFREAGVNPLGGCIPALFQIPIFFALYSFFSASVDLRGAGFLWANDLSAPDKVIQFGSIPVITSILGDHISLFTITAVITSFLISLYSMSMTPDQSNPVLKYMPYIFPIFLLFIFNKLPSALTWYYTVSNLITLILQFVIQNYIIDHNKILAKIDENRKKPKTKSKWQERMEQMQEQQKKLKEIKQKGKR